MDVCDAQTRFYWVMWTKQDCTKYDSLHWDAHSTLRQIRNVNVDNQLQGAEGPVWYKQKLWEFLFWPIWSRRLWHWPWKMDLISFQSTNRIPGSGNSMCRGLEVGNSKLSGNDEAFDQRLSAGHLWSKKWVSDFQPGMTPSVVTEIRQSLNAKHSFRCSQPSGPVRFMRR